MNFSNILDQLKQLNIGAKQDDGTTKEKKIEMNGFDILALMGATGAACDASPFRELNTPMHTTRTGFGLELVPAGVFSAEVFDAVPHYSSIMAFLEMSYHGDQMEKTQTVKIIGDTPMFKKQAEKTADTVFAQLAPTGALATGEVTINQEKLVCRIDVTFELSQFNMWGPEKFFNKLDEKIKEAAARTMESAIINGDTEAGATANINDIAGTPAGDEHWLIGNGLRKTAIATTTPNGDPSLTTLDITDFRTLEGILGKYFGTRKKKCMWLLEAKTELKAKGLQQFYDASVRGEKTTIAGNEITTFDGAPVFIPDDFQLANAAGKIDLDTPSNNSTGGIILAYGPAIQWGRKGGMFMKLYDYGSQGYQLEVWFEMGFTIVNQKVGVTDSVVAYGINVTV